MRAEAPSRRVVGPLFEFAQPVAAAADVEDVAAVEQPVEDRGGEDLVAGQDLRPVADAFVRRDEDAAAPVAVGEYPFCEPRR
jgi:hypothetical protein